MNVNSEVDESREVGTALSEVEDDVSTNLPLPDSGSRFSSDYCNPGFRSIQLDNG